jgi:site-specific recombinase XerD
VIITGACEAEETGEVGDAEWSLYWVDRHSSVSEGFLPQLDQWADIDQREARLGVERGTPILIDPLARIDPRIARFLRRSRFAFRAEGTQVAYAKDYRLFFTFLWIRGKHWDEAEPADIDDYEAWRRRSEDNPRRIGGSKWARELAAFKLLYDWAVAVGHVQRSPVLTRTVRLVGGDEVEVVNHRPKDVRSTNVKWLTPRTFRLWRDIGLRGYDAAGLPDPSWRGRNSGRNAAFADLLFDSGLRLREAGCLLTTEVPQALVGQRYYEGTIAAAVAKRRERMFYIEADALAGVTTYVAVARRAAIRRAQKAGRYDAVRGKRVVTRISQALDRRIAWVDSLGRDGEAAMRSLSPHERTTLFIQGRDGLEPLWLWLGESGLPMDYQSWNKVFGAASDRCAEFGKPIYCTPHVCRHSFALKMLVTLHRALDRRYGVDSAEREHIRQVYGDAFDMVKDLLGHQNQQTTRDTYLEPLNGLRLRQILDGSEELDTVLARVAEASRLVMDIDPNDGQL